ncbi:hypothetical protein RvY_04271 [Ramazzottius varieornatus]|uniref:Uncharacterized protein n=1 Tax=Ramazzottius varieornatus TaxID=947166 RepID=A0A1D1UR31_RAMVA|nr:hypothetical protein RvY_04271 [Ramazzottius varieornatus]
MTDDPADICISARGPPTKGQPWAIQYLNFDIVGYFHRSHRTVRWVEVDLHASK